MNPSHYLDISLFGIEMNPPRTLDLFGLSIHFYGLIIACGLMLAVWYGCKRCNQFGFSVDDLTDGVLCIVPFAILCARLYYCIFDWASYKDNPISVLYIWNGGLAIYGGVIGAAIGVIVFSKVKKIKIGAVLDIVALGFLIGQSIGRWGNFFNREAFGAATDNFMKMGLFNWITQSWEYYHPTFLYESLWNAAGFALLHFLSKKRQYDGQIALGYAAWYGLGRTFIEGLRVDSLYWGDFRVSQMLAAVSCFVAVAVLLYMAFQKHDPARMQVNLTAARQAEAEAEKQEGAPGMEPLFPEREEE
jgi:phosphatidylglycerol:prolipoprotein diacylglycerol transferase